MKKNSNLHQKKNIAIIILTIVVIVAAIVSIFVVRHINTNDENRIVESLTKEILVKEQCIGSLYKDAAEVIQSCINSGQVTSEGYVGEGADPSIYERYIEDQKKALSHLFRNGQYQIHQGDYVSLSSANDTLGNQWFDNLDRVKGLLEQTNVMLSERESEMSGGGMKVWKYTELISGVEFKAAKYKDGSIGIETTDEGSERLYERYIEQYINAYNDAKKMYDRLVEEKKREREKDEEKKREKETDDDFWNALMGAALLGGFF